MELLPKLRIELYDPAKEEKLGLWRFCITGDG